MKHLIIGLGQVGSAIFKNYHQNNAMVFIWDLNCGTSLDEYLSESMYIKDPYDKIPTTVLHICIPESDEFVASVDKYIAQVKPDYVIIHSTLLPGTTHELFKRQKDNDSPIIVYSSVHGQHNMLYDALRFFPKFFAAENELNSAQVGEIEKIFKEGGILSVWSSHTTKQLEVLKLLDTTQYAALIMYAHVEEIICKEFGIEHDELLDLRKPVAMRKGRQRPLIYPGGLGGHCLRPNLDILMKIWERVSGENNINHMAAEQFLQSMKFIDDLYKTR